MEDGGGQESKMVRLLQKSLHGTRDTAANFQREVKKFMRSGICHGNLQRKHFLPSATCISLDNSQGRFHLDWWQGFFVLDETLSSAEAELVASIKVCGETVGLVQLAADWRLDGSMS